MGYPEFRNGFGTLFSTRRADIMVGMLESDFSAELGTDAQTSGYTQDKEWHGGRAVGGKLLT